MEPNNDEVICPNCVHQFRAIPVNVQTELATTRAELDGLRGKMRDIYARSQHVYHSSTHGVTEKAELYSLFDELRQVAGGSDG